MDIGNKQQARETVLATLGLAGLVDSSQMDIAQPHNALVERQGIEAQFIIDGLTIDAPAGIYHPTPDSSTEFFLRNIRGMNSSAIHSALEIGAGCGAISLYMASRWNAALLASDISPLAVEAIKHNAALNRLEIDVVESDMFERIPSRRFDFIVFNAPLIDKEPENELERSTLCDPGGHILRRFLEKAGGFLNKSGLIIFSVCCNTAYEVLADIDLKYRIIGIEVVGNGFWRAIVGGEN